MKMSPEEIKFYERIATERGGAVRHLEVKLPEVEPLVKVPSHVPGRMNKTEAAYDRHLESFYPAHNRHFEAIKLRLADKTWYCPDFFLIGPEGVEFHEVKGWMRDDANVKIKVAASMYPWATFYVVKKIKGGWDKRRVSSN